MIEVGAKVRKCGAEYYKKLLNIAKESNFSATSLFQSGLHTITAFRGPSPHGDCGDDGPNEGTLYQGGVLANAVESFCRNRRIDNCNMADERLPPSSIIVQKDAADAFKPPYITGKATLA